MRLSDPKTQAQMSAISEHLFGCEDPVKYHIQDPMTGDFRAAFRRCRNQCDTCRKREKKLWTTKLIAEACSIRARGLPSSFVTLTYGPDLDDRQPLEVLYRDVQLFFKTLRNRPTMTASYADRRKHSIALPKAFRYFVSGELGPATSRPHWHLVLFGVPSPPHRRDPREKPWKILTDCWTHGFATWEPVTVSSMAYAACYVQKKTDQHENYFQFSKRPGLGVSFWLRRGVQAYHLGKSPQDIQSLRIGKSHWPLSASARDALQIGWSTAAGLSPDFRTQFNSLRKADAEKNRQLLSMNDAYMRLQLVEDLEESFDFLCDPDYVSKVA